MKRKILGTLVAISFLTGLFACGPSLAQKKDQSAIHYRLGVVHLNERNLADALKELTKSVEIYPDDPTYHDALGLAYLAKGMHKEALQSMDRALALNSEYSEAHVNKSAVYMDQRRWPEAIDESFYRTPEDAWFNMGTSYYNMGDFQKAVESYSKAVGANPADARSWYSMGLAYEKMNRTKDAVASYEKATSAFPGYLDAYFSMGMALVKARDKAGAVKAFEKVIEIAPASDKAQSAKEYIGLIK